VKKELSKRLWDALDEDGVDGLRKIVTKESDNHLFYAKKYQEFQTDQDT
jgi:hypothetical protein